MLSPLGKIREDHNYSTRQLEIKTGISRSMLSRLELGKASPTIDHIRVLAKAYKMEPIDLCKILLKEEKSMNGGSLS